MRRRVVPFVTVLAALGGFATGCGLTDEGPRPGVAAEVDGETLALDELDDAVQEYCLLRAAHPEAVAASKASIRAQFVLGWTQAVAVEDLAADYDVRLPSDSIDAATVEENWGDLGTIDEDNIEAFEFLTWIQLRLTTPVEEIGSAELQEQTGEGSVGQPAVEQGVALIQQWLEDNDPELNPVFGSLDQESGLFTGDALSVPVSDEARTGSEAEPTEEQIAALPADQRCGPEAAPAPAQAPGA